MIARVALYFLVFSGVVAMASVRARAAAEPEYLADQLADRIIHANQGFGTLGLNRAVVPSHRPGRKLRIGAIEYERGLGMHAQGVVAIDLGGEFETFDAEVGLQWQTGKTRGSAEFQVFVDNQQRFDSGVMKENSPPRQVRVVVKDADELRLVVTDAGDGIVSDVANWANARLTRDPEAKQRRARASVNVASFARVVTSDPKRAEGTKAGRVEEFPAEDITLTTELLPATDGSYMVPVDGEGVGCLGLEWYEFRYIRQMGLQFADAAAVPDGVQLQVWTGSSSWQGAWRTVDVPIEKNEGRWSWQLPYQQSRRPTDKMRWIFPNSNGPIVVRDLSAETTSFYQTADLRIEAEAKIGQGPVEIEVYNGEWLDTTGEHAPLTRSWDPSAPLRVRVRYAQTNRCKTDQTVLRFTNTVPPVAVSVEQVLENEAVYIPVAGLFVTRAPAPTGLEAYRRKIAGRKTLRQRIHEMPDQTFEHALEVVHKPVQNRGPMMLSLACDQRKFIAYRHGPVAFKTDYMPSAVFDGQTIRTGRQYPWPYELHAVYGDGNYQKVSRKLDGDWLPLPVTSVDEEGLVYRTRSFVAPLDHEPISGAPDWLRRRAVCVVEYTIENSRANDAEAAMTVTLLDDVKKQHCMPLRQVDGGMLAEKDGHLLAFVDTSQAGPLEVDAESDRLTIRGTLAAGSKISCVGYIPAWRVGPEEWGLFRGMAPELARKTREYWRKLMVPAAQIELPSRLLTNVIRASQVHILLAAGNEENGARIDAWTSADRYGALESESQPILRGMDMMGHRDFARRGLEFFIARYNDAGFLTTGYTMMGSGWHLWTLAEFVDRSDDLAWFKQVAPEVARVSRWIARQREKTKRLDVHGDKAPNYGIMPPGVFADWGRFTNLGIHEAHYCAGLREAARVLAKIDHPDAAELAASADDFRDCVVRAYRWTQARTPVAPLGNGTFVPAQPPILFIFGPVGGFFPGEDGSRAWCKNAAAHHLMVNRLLDPNSEETSWMLDIMEGIEFLRTSLGEPEYSSEANHCKWFDLGGFNKCQPYYRRSVELYAQRDEIEPFIRGYFNTMPSLLSLENLSLWEHFHNMGGWNKTHETGWFLCQTRIMLMQERDDQLWLAPFVTRNWLRHGMTVRCQNMPTNFGRAGYEIHSSADDNVIEAMIDPPTTRPPSRIVLRLRHPQGKPAKSVTVNGRNHEDFDPEAETVGLQSGSEQIMVRVKY
jgi:NPCBM/NEW2 domain-containing protein